MFGFLTDYFSGRKEYRDKYDNLRCQVEALEEAQKAHRLPYQVLIENLDILFSQSISQLQEVEVRAQKNHSWQELDGQFVRLCQRIEALSDVIQTQEKKPIDTKEPEMLLEEKVDENRQLKRKHEVEAEKILHQEKKAKVDRPLIDVLLEQLPAMTDVIREADGGRSPYHLLSMQDEIGAFHADGLNWSVKQLENYSKDGLLRHYLGTALQEQFSVDITYDYTILDTAARMSSYDKKMMTSCRDKLGLKDDQVVKVAEKLKEAISSEKLPPRLLKVCFYYHRLKLELESLQKTKANLPSILEKDREVEAIQTVFFLWTQDLIQQLKQETAQGLNPDSFVFQNPNWPNGISAEVEQQIDLWIQQWDRIYPQ